MEYHKITTKKYVLHLNYETTQVNVNTFNNFSLYKSSTVYMCLSMSC